MKLIGIGDNVLDKYCSSGQYFPGGNSVNVAVLAHRYNNSVAAYIGVLADDDYGQKFAQILAKEGLDLSRLRTAHGFSACNYIQLDDATGERYFAGNNGNEAVQMQVALALTDGDFALMAGYDVAHTSIHSGLNGYHAAIARHVDLSMDFSHDGYSWDTITRCCPMLRFAFFSAGTKTEEETRFLAKEALRAGAVTVVVTMGVRGAYILEKGREYRQSCNAVNAVDTLGAGDAYIAAFLAEYYETNGEIEAAAAAAAKFSALCCGHYGSFGRAI